MPPRVDYTGRGRASCGMLTKVKAQREVIDLSATVQRGGIRRRAAGEGDRGAVAGGVGAGDRRRRRREHGFLDRRSGGGGGQASRSNPVTQSERNQGTGAALRRAIAEASGEFAIVQDADLEYDPKDYPRMLAPLADGRADAVYGSRFMVAGERRVLYFWHSLANHLLTGMCNVFADLNLTDMETCYKAFRTPLLKSIPIRSQRFGFEPEITIKLAKRQARIYETAIITTAGPMKKARRSG